MEARRCWVDVHLDRLLHNLTQIQRNLPPGAGVMGVIKANAYGHGYHVVARELIRAGARALAVSNVEEALSLRARGVCCPILIFVPTPPEYAAQLAENSLTQTVFSPEYAAELGASARQAGVRLPIHIKIDTGMARLGFYPDQLDEVEKVCRDESFLVEGMFTHFASADEPGQEAADFTRDQHRRFVAVTDALAQRGIHIAQRHCGNSAGAMRFPDLAMDLVRPGIALYGLSPGEGCDGLLDLRPVMEWKARISMVKTIGAGTPVSYGRTFTAPREMRVATVPVGYADGYGREQSNHGYVGVGGQRAPIVGRVCMDQLIVDVSHIDAAAGDEVCLAGGPGAPGFEQLARDAGTIGYEKLCLVGDRVTRRYLRGGSCVEVASYMP